MTMEFVWFNGQALEAELLELLGENATAADIEDIWSNLGLQREGMF